MKETRHFGQSSPIDDEPGQTQAAPRLSGGGGGIGFWWEAGNQDEVYNTGCLCNVTITNKFVESSYIPSLASPFLFILAVL